MLKKEPELPRRVSKRKMKNRIIAIILVLFLSLPTIVSAVDEAAPATEEHAVVEDVVRNPQTLDEDLANSEQQESNTIQANSYKKPISKRKLVKKFLLAMFSVAVSSFVLYFGLTMYNRIRTEILNEVKTPDGETSLESPDDLTSAVNKFLDKTNWK